MGPERFDPHPAVLTFAFSHEAVPQESNGHARLAGIMSTNGGRDRRK